MTPLAQQLLDAQVRFHLAELAGDRLEETVRNLASDLFAAASGQQIADLVDVPTLHGIVERALRDVPASAGVGGIVEMATDLVYAGPPEPHSLGEVIDRERLEAVLDEVLALAPVLERALDKLVDSPLVATLATRFMGRVVAEVMATNQAIADKVPGLGGLVSFGTSAAAKVTGAAGKQFEGLISDTMGKGGTFAVRRLNKIVLETIQDPTTREAILQVWELASAEQVRGLEGRLEREDLDGLVDALHDLVISTAANEHMLGVGRLVVDAFVDRFGGYTPTELLDELEISRDDVVDDLVRLAPGVVDALRESGDLERIIRARLEPFYASDEVFGLTR
ncbi:hypothetical protein [Nocardioides sp. AE5]|uniref:hypothetical protein n=1 Tax=Nocardioides sp. AE5 TaxID=2962573 RepID=UPI0028810748|nr:hypothetical protein [Nocardioides sp. AE5]MDT0201645.1 hypothetical protein [Nocardioides sp. AE5]